MKGLLVDYTRKKRSVKRGRELKRVPFDLSGAVLVFCGNVGRELAETLEIGISTVTRDLEFAKAWLYSELHRAN